MDIHGCLIRALELHASDLHITANSPPVYRVLGDLKREGEIVSPFEIELMAKSLMTDDQWKLFEKTCEHDFSYSIQGVSRFRVNVYRQRGCISIAIRVVPNMIPSCNELGLPEILTVFAKKSSGLVLVTGPAGSGKSTTLASLINLINQTRRCHIITLEDPIEYLHSHQQSIIEQREVGIDSLDFSSALRAALRQDPDVILVGEMRDLETISTTITAAETGHLVFATLHTSDAVQTIDRIIDVFPPSQQPQIRIQLASVLQGIVSQKLHPSINKSKRVASFEILVNTTAVANLIRTEKTHQISSVMQTGKQFGMRTMEMSLEELVRAGEISENVLKQWS